MTTSRITVVEVLRRRGLALGLYATAVVLVPLGLLSPSAELVGPRAAAEAPAVPVAVPDPTLRSAADGDEPARQALVGLWWRYEPSSRGEQVRFYYFHGDGTGLYRYGRVGLTNTHSFDYDVEGGALRLRFRKTDESHRVRYSLEHAEGEDGRDWLTLVDDPREAGSPRYYREPVSDSGAVAPGSALGPPPAGHMWIDLQPYATGGQGFALYQLRSAGIDGRGVGWFHRGDFDQWSTEWLSYRVVGDRLELHFSLADRHESTGFGVRTDADGDRWLMLDEDPRDFWHAHRYRDVGPSFGAALAPFEVIHPEVQPR